jgi:hypothetical protein
MLMKRGKTKVRRESELLSWPKAEEMDSYLSQPPEVSSRGREAWLALSEADE